jgi:hypothetical protein
MPATIILVKIGTRLTSGQGHSASANCIYKASSALIFIRGIVERHHQCALGRGQIEHPYSSPSWTLVGNININGSRQPSSTTAFITSSFTVLS